MMVHPCIPCQSGFHDWHVDVPEPAPEGVMGGWSCPCRGECRDHVRPVEAREWSEDEYEQFTAMARALRILEGC